MTIEYLIIIKREDDFCKDEIAFMNFLAVDTSIKAEKKFNITVINDSVLNLEVQYAISCEEITNKDERLFNLKMQCKDEKRIEDFNILVRKIKKIALRINPGKTQIHTLQDDIGSYYAIKSYPIIHELENDLRRLITKFMLINVGMDWSKEAMNSEILKPSNKNNKSEIFTDYLHNFDFIDLADVLFKPYRDIEFIEFERIINKVEEVSQIDLITLKKIVSKSNWERYFSSILNIDGKSLEEKWKRLYEIRNEIAHNRYITKGRYEELISIVNSIKPNIVKAIENLDRIKLTPLDMNLIAQALADNNHIRMPRLLAAAKEFNIGRDTLINFLVKKGFQKDELKDTTKLSLTMYSALKEEFREDAYQYSLRSQSITGF